MYKKNTAFFFIVLMIMLLPVVANVVQIYSTGQNIFNFSLGYYNDELMYFHSARQIAENGEVTGINGYGDKSSKNFNFNGWGAAPTYFLGTLYKLFGTPTFMTPVFINILFYLLATIFFAFAATKQKIPKINILLAVGTFSTTILYFFSAMIETFHISFAIIFAASFILLLKDKPQQINKKDKILDKIFIIITILLMIIAVFLRPLWGIILFLYLMFLINKKLNIKYAFLISFFIAISITVIAYIIYTITKATYLDADIISLNKASIFKTTIQSLYKIVRGTAIYIKNGHFFNFKVFNELIFTCCIPFALIVFIILLFKEWIHNFKIKKDSEKSIILLICLFILLSTFFATIAFYLYIQIFRMVLPFAMFIILILASIYDTKSFIKKYWAYLFSMLGITIILFMYNFIVINSGRFSADRLDNFYKEKQKLSTLIDNYDKECDYNNTVVFDYESSSVNITAFPTWIGLNVVEPDFNVENVKSKYFFTKNNAIIEQLLKNSWKVIDITKDNEYIMEKK